MIWLAAVVTCGGCETHHGEAIVRAKEHIPVAGVPAGATVNLRAVTVDGTRTYTKNNVTLSSMTDWRLP